MLRDFQLRALIKKTIILLVRLELQEPVLRTAFQTRINVIAGSSLDNSLKTKISETHPKNWGTLACYFVLSQLFRYSSQTEPPFYYVIYIANNRANFCPRNLQCNNKTRHSRWRPVAIEEEQQNRDTSSCVKRSLHTSNRLSSVRKQNLYEKFLCAKLIQKLFHYVEVNFKIPSKKQS